MLKLHFGGLVNLNIDGLHAQSSHCSCI